jgi:VRR-NUC domain.
MIIKKQLRSGYWVYWDDAEQKGNCRLEVSEQIDSMAWLKEFYPEARKVTFHVPNESDSKPQHRSSLQQQGVTSGVSDIITLWGAGAVFEMKRAIRSKSSVSKEQREFLRLSHQQGKFAALCYGSSAFKQAWLDYLKSIDE